MARIYNIAEGWISYLFGNNPDWVTERAMVCKKCPHAVHGTYEKLMPDYNLKEVQGLKCGKCKCPLSTKLRSENEKCPIGKWK